MGRCVLMVGLPFPNIMSPELKERMDYLNANAARSEDGRSPGQVINIRNKTAYLKLLNSPYPTIKFHTHILGTL